MILGYGSKLDLKNRSINVKILKINSSKFEIFGIILASFQIKDILKKARFLQDMFLFTDFSIKIILKMHFLTFSNANI